jgi:predicted nucleic acid-binding protein
MRLYLDASAIIYSLEGAPPVRELALRRIEEAEQSEGGAVITSQLSYLECRVKPLRDGATELLARIEALFARPNVVLAEVSLRVLDRATALRARHGFKTPDAIHLATALAQAADVFLTGDAGLLRCPGIEVAVIDPNARR